MTKMPVDGGCDECGKFSPVLYSHHPSGGGVRRVCGECRDGLIRGPGNSSDSSELLKRTRDIAYRAALRKMSKRTKKDRLKARHADRKMRAYARDQLSSNHSLDDSEEEK